MSTRKQKPAGTPARFDADWARLDALTDAEIAAQIAADPDVAPDVSGWSLDDPAVKLMEPIDVKAIRTGLGMSQNEFANTFAIKVAVLRDWEQRRHAPRGPALALLRIIEREPAAARRALVVPGQPAEA